MLWKIRLVIVVISLVAGLQGTVGALTLEDLEESRHYEASFVTGYFTGSTYLETRVNGEPVKASTEGGWLMGLRLGVDEEYLGLELTTAGVFADIDLKADPAADLPSANDSSMLLVELNGLWYPTGNNLADGRIKPFITAGPGYVLFDSDFGADNESLFEVNAGGGVKFYLTEEGNIVLRFEYRWHQLFDIGSDLKNTMYQQEISGGIGIRF
jgi:opacity protein-like surface antigen